MVRKFTPDPVPAMDPRGWEKARRALPCLGQPCWRSGPDKLGPHTSPWWDARLFSPWTRGILSDILTMKIMRTESLPTKPTPVVEGCEADESRLCKELWDLPPSEVPSEHKILSLLLLHPRELSAKGRDPSGFGAFHSCTSNAGARAGI